VGDFDYTYDALGRMTELTNPNSETSHWTYQTNGLLSRQTLGNSAYAQHTYNARGLLTQLLNRTNGGSPLAEFVGPSGYYSDMTYDAAGNRLQFQVPQYSPYNGTVEYTYDSQDRLQLEDSTRNGGYEHDPAYDAAFNPTTFRGTSGLTYNDDNQRNAAGYGFDGNGNATTYATYGLTFDAENRLTEYKTSGETVLLTAGYTGDGLRAWKDTDSNADVRTYFLYDGGVLLAEMDASGSIAAVNTWGANGLLSRRVSGTTTYYAYDPQGSVTARLNSSQTVVSSDLYDAYGSLLAGGATDPYGYCGQWGYYKDSETGKTLCTHRYYDPNAGRWLTRDPIGYLGGVNLYAYVGHSPIANHDALGHKGTPTICRQTPDPTPRNRRGDPKYGWADDCARASQTKVFGCAAGDDPDGGSYRHCVAACLLRRRWSFVGSLIRRGHDVLFEDGSADSRADVRAEEEGERRAAGRYSCEIECFSYSNPAVVPQGR
jgi:RHS repeat-associated protein